MKLQKIILLIFISLNFVYANKLIMGYRENERQPLIGNIYDNNGLYLELYSLAAKRIGYDLEVVRKPKKRILLEMKQGKIDFYPGFTFTHPRTKYSYFMENGLPGGDVGISLKDFPDINSLDDLSGRKVLVAAGGPTEARLSDLEHIKLHRVPRLSIEKAFNLIKLKRDDFYVYNKASIDFYIKVNNIDYLKVHDKCCGGYKPMYLGFSINSDKFSYIKNLNFDRSQEITRNNLPIKIDTNSVAYKFQKALEKMKNEGITDKLYKKYYN